MAAQASASFISSRAAECGAPAAWLTNNKACGTACAHLSCSVRRGRPCGRPPCARSPLAAQQPPRAGAAQRAPGGAQAPAFVAGAAGCALVTVASLRAADDRFTELFHIYYQPLLVLLAMLWLWGANVRFFEAARVRYAVCFAPPDQAFLLSGRQIHQARGAFGGCASPEHGGRAWRRVSPCGWYAHVGRSSSGQRRRTASRARLELQLR